MSGDDFRRAGAGETIGTSPDERLTPLVGGRSPDGTTRHPEHDAVPDELLSSVGEALDDGTVSVDDGLVTESLDEILLATIASSSDGTHGTGLMQALERQFDVELSPGTVYPRLHELESEGLLAVHELVQTKQYSIDDPTRTRALVERAAYEHLAMALVLQASIDAMQQPP